VETFRAFSALHLAVLAAIGALMALAVAVGLRRAHLPTPGPVERVIACTYAAAWIVTFGFHLFPPLHDPLKTYPLQMCHLTALAAAMLLIYGRRPLRAIVYFWGLGLCTQAIITPSLSEGPAIYAFWFFWGTHGLIVGVAVYDLIVRRYRPELADFIIACAAAAAYVAIVFPLNLLLGANYGFVGPSRPEVPTIVDFLGPWPQRLVLIVSIVAVVMGMLLAPWSIARRLRRREIQGA